MRASGRARLAGRRACKRTARVDPHAGERVRERHWMRHARPLLVAALLSSMGGAIEKAEPVVDDVGDARDPRRVGRDRAARDAGLELLDGLVRRPEHDQPQHVVSLPRSRPVDIAGALEAGLGELAQRLARLDAHLQHRSKWNESGHKGRQGAMNAARMQHLLRQHTT